ncbi:putative transcription factor C2H2 family [Helianthus annuus]|uniref:Putative zinc finger, RING/FYVE/PHD-type n=1 Tax=Helianthus annuus TaxID=4232 RepID=A0A251U7J6_HELAN|nr:putative transcription factor C2H2 family [Helianthus annuus]KAJ0539166.1 putative transcription factor C2H2 family [Helianthus annuus]KAJ0547244.1 putative transcription factor C2H2 family [Helianthus annuus]KAJ0553816.1 putative transcription factor C2H2 family [Helianthus annuus]KAJ0719475.1 putative transcription factor C2H2 family [Helianthus annuus]
MAELIASDLPREYDGACVQMRMSYSAAAQFLLFFVQWPDCHLAGALGLLRILIYKIESRRRYVTNSKQDDNNGDEERRGSDLDIESEEECGICMEANDKLVLPICTHAMCSRCYNDWYDSSYLILHLSAFVTVHRYALIYNLNTLVEQFAGEQDHCLVRFVASALRKTDPGELWPR